MIEKQIKNLLRFAVMISSLHYFKSGDDVIVRTKEGIAFDHIDLKPIDIMDLSKGYYIGVELPNDTSICGAIVLYSDGTREDVGAQYSSTEKAVTGFANNDLQTILLKLH